MKLKDVIIVLLVLIVCALGVCVFRMYTLMGEKDDEIKSLEKKISKLKTESFEPEEMTEEEEEDDELYSSESTNKNKTSNKNNKTYEVGDTWIVDDEWKLTINSVTSTTERNEYTDKNPAQVVYITYTYENIGYENEYGFSDGLYMDLEPGMSAVIVDSEGEMADSYPGSTSKYPQTTPVGAKCVDAQACVGLNNVSERITLTVTEYDSNGEKQTAKFDLKVD